MTSSSHRFFTILCAMVGCSSLARANLILTPAQAASDLWQFESDMNHYNLISIGNATFDNYGHVEGGLEIGGNLSLDGGSIATQPTKFGVTTAPTLYVAKNLVDTSNTNTSIKLDSGYAALPGLTNSGGYSWSTTTDRLTKSGKTLLDESASSSATADVDPRSKNPATNFTTLQTNFVDISKSLANGGSTNGSVSVTGSTLTFDTLGATSGIVFFSLDASLLMGDKYNGKSISDVSINIPNNVDVVVNVTNANGRTLFGNGVKFDASTGDSRLLWNLEGSGSVDLSDNSDFYGAVLAPQFSVSNSGGTSIDGQIVAASFYDSCAQLDFLGYNPALPPAPEPSTYGLAGATLLGGLVYLRRRSRS